MKTGKEIIEEFEQNTMNPQQTFDSIAAICGETDPGKLVQNILNLRALLCELQQDADIEMQRSELYKMVGERIKSACVWRVIEGEKGMRAHYFAPYPADHVTAIWKRIEEEVTWEKELETILRSK